MHRKTFLRLDAVKYTKVLLVQFALFLYYLCEDKRAKSIENVTRLLFAVELFAVELFERRFVFIARKPARAVFRVGDAARGGNKRIHVAR